MAAFRFAALLALCCLAAHARAACVSHSSPTTSGWQRAACRACRTGGGPPVELKGVRGGGEDARNQHEMSKLSRCTSVAC